MATVAVHRKTVSGIDAEPAMWSDDGGSKRVAIYDRNVYPPSLVRRVGWVNCLGRFSSGRPHRVFSPDVFKVRMCVRCKRPEGIGLSRDGDEQD